MEEAAQEMEALVKRITSFELNFKKCSKANRTKGYLKGRITGLEELWKRVCEGDDKMESYKTKENEAHKYFEDNHFAQLEEKYYRLKGEIEVQLDALEPQRQGNPNVNPNNRNNRNDHDQSKVKLPKISLPTFSGSYHTWLSFKNRFVNLIHNSASLSNVEKLEYLKSCVTDEAERTIQRFQITDENYAAAWNRLNEKYDNKRMLQDTQIETIIDRREIKIETSKEIRELLDIVQESLEALNNMDVDTTNWDPILVVLLKRKLPFKTREEWEKELDPTDVPKYAELIAFLEKRYRTVKSLELVGGVTSAHVGSTVATARGKTASNQRGISTATLLDQCSEDVFIKEKVAKMLGGRNFATPNNFDIMLGTKVYTEIILGGMLKEGGYLAQNTKLGWIISGKGEELSTPVPRRMLLCLHTREKEDQADEILKRFWEIEDAPKRKRRLTTEEENCEKIFVESYRKLSDGRRQVKLPFKENPREALGESRNQVVARWLAMERKFEKDEMLKRNYITSIEEHFALGHVDRIRTSEKQHKMLQPDGSVKYSCYYIPHHAVLKAERKTTKTRIVFDASAKTSSGKSLNHILMIGPTIQGSLISRLMKWSTHKYALRGDITKMYRQIKVYEEDTDY